MADIDTPALGGLKLSPADENWLARLVERAAARGEPLMSVTPVLAVPTSLFTAWWAGHRPLPGQDEHFFYREVARRLGHDQALELQQRHARLRVEEEGRAPALEIPAELAAALVDAGWRPPAEGGLT